MRNRATALIFFVLIAFCNPVLATDPPPLILTVRLEGNVLQQRYAASLAKFGGLEGFQKEVSRLTVLELNKRGFWSSLCWPLHWDKQQQHGGTLQIMLIPQTTDWTINVQLILNNGHQIPLGESGLWQQGHIPDDSGPPGEQLHFSVVERLRTQLLALDTFERFHIVLRDGIPVGSGVCAPPPDVPPQFGLVEVDHPTLRRSGVPFKFVYSPTAFSEERVKVSGTGKRYKRTTPTGATIDCIVVEFPLPPPQPGTTGDVYLDGPSLSNGDLPLL